MKLFTGLAAVVFSLSSVLIPSSLQAQEAASGDKPSFSAIQSVTLSATVEAIDMATRQVTLKGENGTSQTITVGEEARNLGQVQPGDVVTAEFVRELDVEVFADDGSELGAGGLAAAGRAEEGEKPGGMAIESQVLTARVAEINLDANTFKLQWPDESVQEYTARNPENLRKAAVGDIVVITYTEAVGIIVEAPAGE
jgi:Cu/Ag efflux protein CusF